MLLVTCYLPLATRCQVSRGSYDSLAALLFLRSLCMLIPLLLIDPLLAIALTRDEQHKKKEA
jgi:hypothetical protein